MKITTLFFLSLIFLSSGFLNKSFKLLYINTSNSLPQGLYLNLPVFELKKNDLVLICLNEEMAKFAKERNYIKKGDCPLNTAPLGKKITGIFNDKVIFKKDFILVNNIKIKNSKPLLKDSLGRNLPKILGEILIKKGEYLLLNEVNDSFDSRYFGTISTSNIKGKLIPVFTL